MRKFIVITEDSFYYGSLERSFHREANSTFRSDNLIRFCDVLSHFITFRSISKSIEQRFDRNLIESEINEWIARIPNSFISETVSTITRKLVVHFMEKDDIQLDGFITFSLKEPLKDIHYIVKETMNHSYQSFSSFKQYFSELRNASSVDKLELIFLKDGRIKLSNATLSRKEIYFNQQENALQAILESPPKNLKIKDPHNSLEKDFVLLLRKLFLERVSFE